MCGFYFSTIKYTQVQVEDKLKRFNFRGPDYSSIKEVDNICLGHNRLSIIDLDERSAQPFLYEHLYIVFNGEIYNYVEIKESLLQLGYKFRTTSDTEVICAAYIEYGEECLNHFNGMFAFVIYNTHSKRIFGARDRLGKKPFYYSLHNGEGLECSSQLAAIKLLNNFQISDSAICDYLNWGYIPEPKSIYNEISKLPAGNYFIYDTYKKDFNLFQYYDLPKDKKFLGDFEEAKTELHKLALDSVKIRLLSSDVPVGIFLSGGIDSSLVTALAARISDKPINTFSVKFNSKEFDESEHASLIAKHLKSNHHTIECDVNQEEDLLENFSYFYDEPFADSSALPSLLLAKYTKENVTVALSGDGGDEFFLGYERYKYLINASKLYQKLSYFRIPVANILKLIPKYKAKIISNALLSSSTIEELYLNNITSMDKSWYNCTFRIEDIPNIDYLLNSNKSFIERVSDFEIKSYMNNDIITKVDRASMAYSLEVRSPLMDYRILEFAKSLPFEFKISKGKQKFILKDLLESYVPKELIDRPKAGFSVPLSDWFKNKLKNYVIDTLSYSAVSDFPMINYDKVKEMIGEHMSGTRNRSVEIWKLLVLINWKREMDNV